MVEGSHRTNIPLQKGLKAGAVSTFWVFKNENFHYYRRLGNPSSIANYALLLYVFLFYPSRGNSFVTSKKIQSFDCFEIKILWSFLHCFHNGKEKGNYSYLLPFIYQSSIYVKIISLLKWSNCSIFFFNRTSTILDAL